MKFLRGFKYAFSGVLYTINHERNLRVHIIVSIYLLYFLSYYNVSTAKMAVLLIAMALVIGLEFVNTAIERVCDLYSKEYNPLIKIAKDAAAGAVLVAAVFAVAIAVFLLWDVDTIWKIIEFHCGTPERFALLALTVILSLIFIILGPKKMFENAKSLFVKESVSPDDE